MTPTTVVMNHVSAEAYLWAAAWNLSAGSEWVAFSGIISGAAFNGGVSTFPPGTAYAKLQLIANSNQIGLNATLLFDDLRVEVSP